MTAIPLFAYNVYLVHLPILIVIVSIVYSATRHERWPAILKDALGWGLRLAGFLAAVALVLWFVNKL